MVEAEEDERAHNEPMRWTLTTTISSLVEGLRPHRLPQRTCMRAQRAGAGAGVGAGMGAELRVGADAEQTLLVTVLAMMLLATTPGPRRAIQNGH